MTSKELVARFDLLDAIGAADAIPVRARISKAWALKFAFDRARAENLDAAAFHAMLRVELADCNDGERTRALNDIRDAFEEILGVSYSRALGIVAIEYAIDNEFVSRRDEDGDAVVDPEGDASRWRARARALASRLLEERAARAHYHVGGRMVVRSLAAAKGTL